MLKTRNTLDRSPSQEVKKAGYTFQQLRAGGFTVEQLRHDGFKAILPGLDVIFLGIALGPILYFRVPRVFRLFWFVGLGSLLCI